MSENLIELVRQYEVLYNPKYKDYKDQTIRTATWEEIANILREPVEKCKNDWGKLRNAYASAINRRKHKKPEQASINEVPWKYEEQMNFLRPHMELRSAKTIIVKTPLEPSTQDNSPGSSLSTNETQISMTHHQPLPTTNKEPHRTVRRQKKSEFQEILDLMRESNDLKREKQCRIHNLDGMDLFFMSISKSVKALPKADQTRIKLDILTILSKAEMEIYNEDNPF